MNIYGMRALTAGIVVRAVKDYYRAWKSGDTTELRKCERFFLSQWFELINPIPSLTGEEMMRRIRENFDPKKLKKLEKGVEC